MTDTGKILIIDDEELVRDMIGEILADEGYEVVEAANGDEGLKLLASVPVDLVITDILMPEKEGIETIIEIRKSHPELRILAISGGGRLQNLQPLNIASRLGAAATLRKPFQPDELTAAVQHLLSTTTQSGQM